MPLSRRELLARGATLALGGFALSVPEALLTLPSTAAAAALTPGNVEASFIAAVEAITTVAHTEAARWVIREFDRALPPAPNQVAVTSAVAALLDAQTVAAGYGPSFTSATPPQRRVVLGNMVKNSDATVRQIANQLIPFCAFGYWSDATLPPPAQPGGPTLARWAEVGFPGPSHGYLDTYTADGPPGFTPMTNFEP